MPGRCWGCGGEALGRCQDVLDSMRDVMERKMVVCVWGVGVGISSSLYTAPVKGGPYKGRKVISQCCFGRCGGVVKEEMERCWRGAAKLRERCWRGSREVHERCWRGADKLLDRCERAAAKVLGRC